MSLFEIPNPQRGAVAYLCAIWALAVVGWAVVVSATPLILKDVVGASDAADWMGTLTATTALSGMIFCSLVGYFSDRSGRFGLLVPWLIIFFLSTVLVVYADVERTVLPILMARVVALSIPSTLVYALASDIVEGPLVMKVHGLLGASFGCAVLVGSGLCGIVARAASRPMALVIGTLFAASGALVASVAPASINGTPKKSVHESYWRAAQQILQRDPLLRNTIVAFAIIKVANVNTMFMFTLYANYRFEWDILDTAMLMGVVGALGICWQYFGIRYIVDRHDNVIPVLIGCLALLPISVVGYGASITPGMLWVSGVGGSIIGVAASIFTTKITVMASEDGISGTAMGLVGTLQNFIEMFAALGFGRLLRWSILNYGPTDFSTGIPFYVNACFYASSLLIVVYSHRRYGKERVAWMTHVTSSASSPLRPPTDETYYAKKNAVVESVESV